MSKPHSILAVLALGATLALAGCADSSSSSQSPTSLPSFTPDPAKLDAYHTLIRDMPVYRDVTNTQLDEIAVKVCQLFALNEKTGWDEATSAVALTKDDPLPPRILVMAAVTLDCKQYLKDIPPEYR